MMRLERSFFARDGVIVAQDLLGQVLVFENFRGLITESEIYRGTDDPASHAFRGPTKRCEVMFGTPGISYVYFIYGMYYCLNIVVEPEGSPAAVLIRGLLLFQPTAQKLDGPGKICRLLNLTCAHHGFDMVSHSTLYVEKGERPLSFSALPRVGLRRGQDKKWRFCAQHHCK